MHPNAKYTVGEAFRLILKGNSGSGLQKVGILTVLLIGNYAKQALTGASLSIC
jgi:hypothetical protein